MRLIFKRLFDNINLLYIFCK